MFEITENKGFQMTFPNGITISVQFGQGNYCSRRHSTTEIDDKKVKSTDAEIAIWDQNNTDFYFGKQTTEGWCTTEKVSEWINRCMMATSIHNI